MTQAERSLIIYRLMSETWYGNSIEEYGLDKMVQLKMFLAAFPVHDSGAQWSNFGPLSDRQVGRTSFLFEFSKKKVLFCICSYWPDIGRISRWYISNNP